MRTRSARLYRYTVLRNSADIIGKVNQGRNSKVVPEGTFGGNFAREMVQVRWKSCWRQPSLVVDRRTSARNARLVWFATEQKFCAAGESATKDFRDDFMRDGGIRSICMNCVCTSLRIAAIILTASSVPRLQRPTTISLNHSFACKPEPHESLAKFTLSCLPDPP